MAPVLVLPGEGTVRDRGGMRRIYGHQLIIEFSYSTTQKYRTPARPFLSLLRTKYSSVFRTAVARLSQAVRYTLILSVLRAKEGRERAKEESEKPLSRTPSHTDAEEIAAWNESPSSTTTNTIKMPIE